MTLSSGAPKAPQIRHLFISPGHNFFGRHGQTADTHPILEVERLECVAGRGIVGDRFFDYKPDYKGQITFFSWEVLLAAWETLGVGRRDPSAPRRNVIIEGVDLNALIGQEFDLQGVRFAGIEESRPCYWMDQAIGPGAEAFLRGRGGLRAKILTSGSLCRE
ncbi:MAG TPA: molybdenum cofactor biosysynthesis protein [Verrucomicrobiae bacterium]|nr:molybdenum cofactor biosysynthesis protein [Verrucomicrobiae bacterium]